MYFGNTSSVHLSRFSREASPKASTTKSRPYAATDRRRKEKNLVKRHTKLVNLFAVSATLLNFSFFFLSLREHASVCRMFIDQDSRLSLSLYLTFPSDVVSALFKKRFPCSLQRKLSLDDFFPILRLLVTALGSLSNWDFWDAVRRTKGRPQRSKTVHFEKESDSMKKWANFRFSFNEKSRWISRSLSVAKISQFLSLFSSQTAAR